MRKTFLPLAVFLSLLSTQAARAEPFECAASTLGFQIRITGAFAGTHAVGCGKVIVTRDGQVAKEVVLTAESSDFARNQHIQLTGMSSDGRGIVNATFVGGSEYEGTLRASIDGLPIYTGIRCSF